MTLGDPRRPHHQRILALLRCEGRPRSAYQILEALRPEGVNAPTTVYRALERLQEDGRVHRVESLNAYIACCDPNHAESAVFVICDSCGAVSEHLTVGLSQHLGRLADSARFSPRHAVIELRGQCAECQCAVAAS